MELIVIVEDVNDNAPEFIDTSCPSPITVQEVNNLKYNASGIMCINF